VWRVIQAGRRNSVRGGLLGISLEMSSSRGGASRKTATGREPGQSVVGRRKDAFGRGLDGPSHGGKSAKGCGERGQELKGFTVWLQPKKELR